MTLTDLNALVRQAARALGRAGLVHAFGHCSARIDAQTFLVCAPMPLGLIRDQPGTIVPLDGPLPAGVLGEVRVHREIYRRRPDANGICRVMPPTLMALSTQGILPRPRHGLGAYFSDLRYWDDPQLLRDDASAERLADTMADAPAIVMRGNGAIVAGSTLQRATVLAWLLEDTARMERDVRAMVPALDLRALDAEEISARAIWDGGIEERLWVHLTCE